jgi:hypothetical protein
MHHRVSLRTSLLFLTLLGASAAPVRADTMYKCVDGAGKVAYTSTPCQGKSQAKAFSVATPLDDEALAQAEEKRLRDLRKVKDGIALRAAERRHDDAQEAYEYRPGAAAMRGAAKPNPDPVPRSGKPSYYHVERRAPPPTRAAVK